jgi:hypothetical protein
MPFLSYLENNMNLWTDGRSGPAGCFAGNLVLAELERLGEKIVPRKGTTFNGENGIYVGRMNTKDDYLNVGTRHWSNLSPKQAKAIATEANSNEKEDFYLFITATKDPTAVHFWNIPGKLVVKLLNTLPVKPSDDSCLVRIREEKGKHLLEGTRPLKEAIDVTNYHHQVPLIRDQGVALQLAFQKTTIARNETEGITAEDLRKVNALVRELGGVATVRQALDILEDLKG